VQVTTSSDNLFHLPVILFVKLYLPTSYRNLCLKLDGLGHHVLSGTLTATNSGNLCPQSYDLLHHHMRILRGYFSDIDKFCASLQENKCSAVAEMGDRLATTDMDRKLGWGGCAPFKRSWIPCNTMWPGPRPTSISSGVLIYLAVWPQQTVAENWGGGSVPFWGKGSWVPI